MAIRTVRLTTVDAPGGKRRTLARELVARGMILPILDGLDEMSPARHSPAMAAISSAAGSGGRFVLTSRTKAYERAVHDSSPLARTPVVELQPLTPDDAARYLVDGTDQPIPRWHPVLAELAELAELAAGKRTPLVQTLSTPLMTWLARVVYQHRGSDPAELVTAEWAATRAGIEKHLLQQLVPAAYAAAVGGHPGRTPVEARQAQRRLTTLARHLHADRTYDLAWWRLNEISPGPATQIAAVLLSCAAMLICLVLAISGVEAAPDVVASHPRLGPLWNALAAGLTVGVLIGLARRLFEGQRYPRRVTFAQLRTYWLVVGCPVALVAVLAGEPVAGVVAALAAGSAAAFVAGGRHAGGNDQRGLSPAALLIEDRQSAAAAGVAGLLASGAGFIDLGFPPDMTGLGVLFAVILLGPVPAAAVLSGAWGQFCVARVVLFACRRTPLRLMSFLSEAHDRGVLRQAGGVYQFRHNLLQDHLAAPPATAPAGRAAP